VNDRRDAEAVRDENDRPRAGVDRIDKRADPFRLNGPVEIPHRDTARGRQFFLPPALPVIGT